MEIKLEQEHCRHLRSILDQPLMQEETMEVRLPESMPDIGRVLGAWGRMILRSKEWRSGSMSVGGGVMAWVMYVPEDGSEVRSVECWVPFQMRWDFPEPQNDGFILVTPMMQGMDARSVSARKLILRVNVGARGQALEQVQADVSIPGSVPEDVQLLRRTYPMELEREYGEKMVDISEELEAVGIDKILRYDIQPSILEQKVIASRLVFRGKATVTVWYLADGRICSRQWEIPFSQYADLDREYGQGATGKIRLMTTNQELDASEGKLMVKCSFGGQYVICDRSMLEIVEDAYSTTRTATLTKAALTLPAQLDTWVETVNISQDLRVEGEKVVDAAVYWEQPQFRRNGMTGNLGISALCNVLYYDQNGQLQSASGRIRKEIEIPMAENVALESMFLDARIQSDFGNTLKLDVTIPVSFTARSTHGQPMVTAVSLGEMKPVQDGRPSLLVRRFGSEGLWELAKQTGSTMEEILRVNALTEEPELGKMVLIPIVSC